MGLNNEGRLCEKPMDARQTHVPQPAERTVQSQTPGGEFLMTLSFSVLHLSPPSSLLRPSRTGVPSV